MVFHNDEISYDHKRTNQGFISIMNRNIKSDILTFFFFLFDPKVYFNGSKRPQEFNISTNTVNIKIFSKSENTVKPVDKKK